MARAVDADHEAARSLRRSPHYQHGAGRPAHDGAADAAGSAIEAPRVRAYRDRLVDVEGRIPDPVRDGLRARGHQVNVIDDWSWIVGGGQGIRRDPESGALQGGADPRRDGYALAI
jgi:gamma-glutamyltranspeptidase